MLRTSNPETKEQVRLVSSPSRKCFVFRNVQHEELHLVYRGSHAWNLLDPSVADTRAYAKMAINSQALKNLNFSAESPLAMMHEYVQ